MINMKTALLLNFLWLGSVIAYSPEENVHQTRSDELVEGDIKVLPGLARGSITSRLWPSGVFVYEIDSSLDDPRAKQGIQSAMKAWNEKTKGCITFKERTTETAYVLFFRGSGCWSYVGRTGSMQRLSLASGCWRHGTIAHEIGHALGFLHEQSRPDRDSYVEVKFENIQSGREGNFRKSSSVNPLGTPYDYGSIMHYGERFFSKNGKPTIVPKKAGVTIGQRAALSLIDVEEMKKLYQCSGSSINPPATTPPVEGISFECNFDTNLCGFNQGGDWEDAFDWTRKTGPTPSRSTGPSGDHTGGGSYLYIEASHPRRPGQNAKLSRMVTLSGKSCLQFYYHMYGSGMGTLKVHLQDASIFEISGDQGNEWKKQKIPLQGSGPKELSFEGITGGYKGDAAIDDITVYDC